MTGAGDVVFNGTSFNIIVALVGVLWASLLAVGKLFLASKDYQLRFVEAQLAISQQETKEWQKTAQSADDRLAKAVAVLGEAVAEVQMRRPVG